MGSRDRNIQGRGRNTLNRRQKLQLISGRSKRKHVADLEAGLVEALTSKDNLEPVEQKKDDH
jgi:hypothetical protein